MPQALCPNNHQVAALHQPQGGARALPISDGSALQEKAMGKLLVETGLVIRAPESYRLVFHIT